MLGAGLVGIGVGGLGDENQEPKVLLKEYKSIVKY